MPECSFTLPRYVTFYNLPLCFSDPHVSIASADQVGALEQDGRAVEGCVPSDTLRRCLSCSSRPRGDDAGAKEEVCRYRQSLPHPIHCRSRAYHPFHWSGIPTPGAGLPSSSDEAKPLTPKAELPSTDLGAELSPQLPPAEFPPIPAGLPSSSLARANVIGDLLYPAGIGFHLQEATALTDEIAAERERVESDLSHSGPTASLQLAAPLAALSLLAIQAPSSPARTPAECFGEGAVSRSPVLTASTSHPVRSVTSNSIMHCGGWTKNVRKRRSRRAAAAAAVFPRPPGQPLTLTKIIQACCKVWDVSVTSGPARGRKRKLCELLSVTDEMLSSGAPLTFHLPSSTPARAAR